MSGPQPTPTSLRLIRGNPSHRPLNKGEPEAPAVEVASLPDPPADLSEAARPYWADYAGKLARMRVLTTADLQALCMLCESTATYFDAMRYVRRAGIIVKAASSDRLITNPYLIEAHKAQAQVLGLLAHFGLTPSSRSRIQREK